MNSIHFWQQETPTSFYLRISREETDLYVCFVPRPTGKCVYTMPKLFIYAFASKGYEVEANTETFFLVNVKYVTFN